MLFECLLIPATFRDRPNRFLGVVQIGGKEVKCFIPNPGRMRELLHKGSKVYLIEKASDGRKTDYDLVVVDIDGTLISVDSRVPNKIAAEAIEGNLIQEFSGLSLERGEFVYGDSRLDFLLKGATDMLLLEVKSCTLVVSGTAIFPDAPTTRGRRHLAALTNGLTECRAAVIFIIQRPDAHYFRPNDATDPRFGESLREAAKRGVEIYAYNCDVDLEGISLKEKVPILL
jgi:sugar fermentation stimulation protein A